MESPLTDAQWAERISSVRPAILEAAASAKCTSKTRSNSEVAGTIDHTQLKPEATAAQIDSLCAEAREHNFATVCVREPFTSRAATALKGSGIGLAVVIGFHTGLDPTASKVREAQSAVSQGATELDAVLNRPDLCGGHYSSVYAELRAIRDAVPEATKLKLIFETARLSDDQIVAAAVVAHAARWEYIKTSTGFDGHGATREHVRLMVAAAEVLAEKDGWRMKVKASGGIRNADDARGMLDEGAERLGCSAGVAIVSGDTVAAGQY